MIRDLFRRGDPDAERRERERREQLQDLRAVLATPEGRRVLWRVLEHCRIYDAALGPDPQETAFRAGRRAVGCWALGEITAADAERWLLMQREHATRPA